MKYYQRVTSGVLLNLNHLYIINSFSPRNQLCGFTDNIPVIIVPLLLCQQAVRQIVTEALEKFSADKIAMPDFALESAGLYYSFPPV